MTPNPSAARPSQSLSDRQAEYAAWRDRLMNRTRVEEEPPPAPSRWTVESLFTGEWTPADA
jgi:hypothetical protein